ncbi:MAG: hypothetical protein ACE363_06475 [Alphaproteobacteria bacterium]
MSTSPQQPIMIRLIVEAARLHWDRVLAFLVTTALLVPGALLAASMGFDIMAQPEIADPNATVEVAIDPVRMLVALAILGVLSAATFVIWMRIALLGTPAAFQQPIRTFIGQMLKTLGYMIAAGLIGLVPISFLAGMMAVGTGSLSTGATALIVLLISAAVTGAFALFFLPLAEIATDTRPLGTSEQRGRITAFRPQLALTLIVATFAVTFLGGVLVQILTAIGAIISAGLAQALMVTLSITVMAAIMGLALRHVMQD